MVWNTIAHPKMMEDDHPGGLVPPTRIICSPIKFADTHKLSFYDAIVSMPNVTFDPSAGDVDTGAILVKGDFETLKHMILNDEAVCVAAFSSVYDGSKFTQQRTDFVGVEYMPDMNAIALLPLGSGNTIYLHSDNTITKSLVAP